MMNDNYDLIVVGAGNGGLIAALTALQHLKRVLVIEQHNLPGGFATSFVRGRFEFEGSLHELCEFGGEPGQGSLRTLFDDLGVTDKIEWIRIESAYRYICAESGIDVHVPFGIEKCIKAIDDYVPGSRASLEKFFKLYEGNIKAIAYINSTRGNPDSEVLKAEHGNFLRCGSYTVQEVLDQIKMPRAAQEILTGYWVYLGAHCKMLSFLHFTLMTGEYMKHGAYAPSMRSHEMSLAIAERIRECGGEIWYNSRVEKILTADGAVSGVRLENGREVYAKNIVCNCSPHNVFFKMMDIKDVPTQNIQLANARELGARGFSAFIGLDKSAQELGIKEHNYLVGEFSDSVKVYKSMEKIETNNSFVMVCLNNCIPGCSPENTSLLYFTTLFTADAWGDISEEDYFNKKSEFAMQLIDNFEKATGIKIKEHIEELEVATPITYAHYTGAPQGAIYGYLAQTWDSMMPRQMMVKEDNKIKGLRFCGGSGDRSSGYSSSYISGNIAALRTILDIRETNSEGI